MSTGYSRYQPPDGKRGPRPDDKEKGGEEKKPKALLAGDPLGRLMVLHPLFVGVVFLAFGWGSLFLLAWRLDVITSDFLRNPAFMVGDLLLLPLCGALMASFYRSSEPGMQLDLRRWIVATSAVAATIAAGATATFSIFVTETYHGIWSVPHTLFIWFFAYAFVSFLPRAFILVVFNLSSFGIFRLMFIMILPMAHIMLKSYLGGSLH